MEIYNQVRTGLELPQDGSGVEPEAAASLYLPASYLEQQAVVDALEWSRLSQVDPVAAEAWWKQRQTEQNITTGEIGDRVIEALRSFGYVGNKIFRTKSPESILAKVERRGDDMRPLSDLSGGMVVIRPAMSEERGRAAARGVLQYLSGYFHNRTTLPDGSPTIEEGVAPWSRTGFIRRGAKLYTEVGGKAVLFEIQAYTSKEFEEYGATWDKYAAERPKSPVARVGQIAVQYA